MNLQKIINQKGTTLIDVRESFETLMGKAKGAINIPLGTLPERLEDIKAMNTPIVLYCRSGNRSGQAVAFLKAQGITEVYNGGSLGEVKELLANKKTV